MEQRREIRSWPGWVDPSHSGENALYVLSFYVFFWFGFRRPLNIWGEKSKWWAKSPFKKLPLGHAGQVSWLKDEYRWIIDETRVNYVEDFDAASGMLWYSTDKVVKADLPMDEITSDGLIFPHEDSCLTALAT